MSGHGPIARNVCQRQVSLDQVSWSVRGKEGAGAH